MASPTTPEEQWHLPSLEEWAGGRGAAGRQVVVYLHVATVPAWREGRQVPGWQLGDRCQRGAKSCPQVRCPDREEAACEKRSGSTLTHLEMRVAFITIGLGNVRVRGI